MLNNLRKFVAICLLSSTLNAYAIPLGVYTTCKTPGLFVLTFDDGVTKNYTPLLDFLSKKKAKATFFVIGNTLLSPQKTEILKRVYSEGHTIANHTYDHPNLNKISNKQIIAQVGNTQNGLNSFGKIQKYMRPPYGAINQNNYNILTEMDFKVILWNIDARDWDTKISKEVIWGVYLRILDNANPVTDSFISLQHDRRTASIELVPRIIDLARAKGFKIATMDECL